VASKQVRKTLSRWQLYALVRTRPIRLNDAYSYMHHSAPYAFEPMTHIWVNQNRKCQYAIVLTLTFQRSNLKCKSEIQSTAQRDEQAIITAKISDCTLKATRETHSALQQRIVQLQKQSARMSLWIRAVDPRCTHGKAQNQGCDIETTRGKIHSVPEQRRFTAAETHCGSAWMAYQLRGVVPCRCAPGMSHNQRW